MKPTKHSLTVLALIGLVGGALALTGCQSSGDRSYAQKWGDRQVAGNVKKELAKDPDYKYPDVQPVVNQGVVQLGGFVDTPEQRQHAAELASRAVGVQQVINTIAIKPARTITESPNTNAPALPPGVGGSPDQEPKPNP